MRNKKLIILGAVLLTAAGISRIYSGDVESSRVFQNDFKHVGTVGVETTANHNLKDDMSESLEAETRRMEAQLRTTESYEAEFGSSPDETLRTEVAGIDAALEPVVKASNERALNIDERAQIASGLRKKQALLKILIDRKLDESRERMKL